MERRRMTRQQDTRLTAEKTFFFCFVLFLVSAPLFLSFFHSHTVIIVSPTFLFETNKKHTKFTNSESNGEGQFNQKRSVL